MVAETKVVDTERYGDAQRRLQPCGIGEAKVRRALQGKGGRGGAVDGGV